MSTKNPVWVAANYNIGDDAASVTWGTENTSANVENTRNFRLRVRVAETNSATTANIGSWVLQGIVNGGTPFTITSSSAVKYVDSTHVTDGTTNFSGILSDIPATTYDQTWNEQDENNTVTSRTWSDNECEYEYSLNLNSVSVGNTVTFRMLSPSSSTAVTFDNIPTITVVAFNTNRAPGAGSGTFAGSAPTDVQDDPTAVGAGSAAFTGQGPHADILSPYVTGGGPGLMLGLALNLEASASVTRSPGKGSGTFAGSAPTLAQTANHWIDVGAGSGTFSGSAPVAATTAHQWIDVGVGNPNDLTGYAPTAATTAHQWANPGAGSATLAGSAPTLAQTANQWIDVGAGAGTFAGAVPVAQNGASETATPDKGTGTFAGYAPTLDQTAHQWVDVPSGAIVGAGSAPVPSATAHHWVSVDSGSGAFSGEVPTLVEASLGLVDIPAGSGAFTGYGPTAVNSTPTAAPEQFSGGWDYLRYETWLAKREKERKRLERAIEEEIAALLQGETPVPAEQAAPEYVRDLREFVAQAQREEAFRQFVEGLRLAQLQDELARLLAIDRAIRKTIRRQRDEEEFIALLLMAA